jgi:hypothetical protein
MDTDKEKVIFLAIRQDIATHLHNKDTKDKIKDRRKYNTET